MYCATGTLTQSFYLRVKLHTLTYISFVGTEGDCFLSIMNDSIQVKLVYFKPIHVTALFTCTKESLFRERERESFNYAT